jgi:ubiquinone/menaquinone biosynthesis C-methylase UbiE
VLKIPFSESMTLSEEVCMAEFSADRVRQFYAETYDTVVPDWPGEIDFYRQLAARAQAQGQAVLEVACGTGRVTMALALEGIDVVGLDLSPAMLSVARGKSSVMTNVRWVEGDMRSFDLRETFGLAIIPGHSFQNLLTAEDQAASLRAIRRHLIPGGTLVVHLDHLNVSWLGELTGERGGVFQPAGSFRHPRTGQQIRTAQAWSYEPASQIAISQTVWEAIDQAGEVTERWESGPLHYHCLFRFEMEHLLARCGLVVRCLYGDFLGHGLRDDSSEMVWVARRE